MTEKNSSRRPGFYNISISERQAQLDVEGVLSEEEFAAITGVVGLTVEQANHMIENVVGTHGLPLGIGLNFQINGVDVLVPMTVEE
ncbi:MAG: 3-hydroxy-3-methylglutaryl-CoA reductase, partial [Chloroflexota bacterium]